MGSTTIYKNRKTVGPFRQVMPQGPSEYVNRKNKTDKGEPSIGVIIEEMERRRKRVPLKPKGDPLEKKPHPRKRNFENV